MMRPRLATFFAALTTSWFGGSFLLSFKLFKILFFCGIILFSPDSPLFPLPKTHPTSIYPVAHPFRVSSLCCRCATYLFYAVHTLNIKLVLYLDTGPAAMHSDVCFYKMFQALGIWYVASRCFFTAFFLTALVDVSAIPTLGHCYQQQFMSMTEYQTRSRARPNASYS